MSMLYNLSISTLRNKIRMQNRLRTAIAYSLYLYRHLATCTCKASLPHVFRYKISANSIMNVIKLIIIAVAYN